MVKTLKHFILYFLLIAPFVLFLLLRLDRLPNDMSNSDAARWHRRSAEFFVALKTGNFSETYQSYHPGVTLMWISTAVEWGLKIQAKINNTEFKSIGNTDGYALIDTTSKSVLVFVLFALLLLQYRFLDILFDRVVALAYVYLVAIEPYFIGINRWYHLTSLEVFLGFTAFLSLLIWADTRIRKYLPLSGVLLGLALLTKFSSIIIVPAFAVVFVVTALKDKNRNIKQYSSDVVKFALYVAGTFVILFPAMWVTPGAVLQKLYAAGTNAQSGEYTSVVFAEKYPNAYYFWILLYKLSPITLVLTVLALIKSVIWRERLVTSFVIYFLSTFLLLTVSEQKIERYILVFLPAIFVLCAVALSRAKNALIHITVAASLVFLYLVYVNFGPKYSAYYMPFLGGPAEAYARGLYDDSGEYYADAARYLNEKGRDIHVFVPNNVESFSYYFKGNLDSQLELTTDYFVTSNDSRRQRPLIGVNCPEVEKVFTNYNFDAVTIYKCHEIKVDF